MPTEKKHVRAIHAGGVLRPLEPIDLPEDSEVEVVIYPDGAWAELRAAIAQIHSRTGVATPEEIEADVREAIREVRIARNSSDASGRP